MKTNVNLWWILAAFFLLVFAVYTGWNIIAHPDRAWVPRSRPGWGSIGGGGIRRPPTWFRVEPPRTLPMRRM